LRINQQWHENFKLALLRPKYTDDLLSTDYLWWHEPQIKEMRRVDFSFVGCFV